MVEGWMQETRSPRIRALKAVEIVGKKIDFDGKATEEL
jgi:hypothetical protein